MRRLIATFVTMALLAVGAAGSASAQNQAGDSLVNVQIGDVTILLPIAIAANLCDINVNLLAAQVDAGETRCTADATSIATPGPGNDKNGGGGNQAGNSLVNVQIGDITLFLPVAIAANVCDVNVNALAVQMRTGPTTCDADADSSAG